MRLIKVQRRSLVVKFVKVNAGEETHCTGMGKGLMLLVAAADYLSALDFICRENDWTLFLYPMFSFGRIQLGKVLLNEMK